MNSEKIKQQLTNDGYVILANVLSNEECNNYKLLLEECYEKYSDKHANNSTKSEHGLDNKVNEKIVYNLHNKDFSFVKLLDHSKVFSILAFMLQEGSYNNSEPFIYALSTARNPLKSTGNQQLHVDSRCPGVPYALVAQVIFCLDDFTHTNGATRVVPGSHRLATFPENRKIYKNEVTLTAPKGAAIVYNGGLWHGSSKKMDDTSRWGLIYTYARWFYKPSFDFNKNLPKHFYERLTDQQKDLLGYKCNPPKDEFTRISSRSSTFEEPLPYILP